MLFKLTGIHRFASNSKCANILEASFLLPETNKYLHKRQFCLLRIGEIQSKTDFCIFLFIFFYMEILTEITVGFIFVCKAKSRWVDLEKGLVDAKTSTRMALELLRFGWGICIDRVKGEDVFLSNYPS